METNTSINAIYRFEERAQDAVSRLMIRRLMVPTIFFSARWPDDSSQVDLLIIDRAGVGDVHVVEIRNSAERALEQAPDLMRIPAHYRWLVFPSGTMDPHSRQLIENREVLHPEKGTGRIGLIDVIQKEGDELEAKILLVAERFAGSYYDAADQFIASHKPDLEFR